MEERKKKRQEEAEAAGAEQAAEATEETAEILVESHRARRFQTFSIVLKHFHMS